MTFAAPQVRKLRARLNPRHVKSRDAEGTTLHYLEGWHVVAEANRIFGFDGWDRETVSSDCVWTRQVGQRFCAAYVARVRITVRAGETRIIREGCGVGDSNGLTPGQAHDFAAKAAETDATKRALMTFGNAFGLSLYKGAAANDPTAGRSQTQRKSTPASMEIEPPPAGSSREMAPTFAPVDQSKPAPNQLPKPRASVARGQSERDIFPPDRVEPGFGPGVDKSVLALAEPKRIRDADHLRNVASQPCLVCGRTPSEAHHLRFAQPRAMSRKVSDEFTIPLCALHHRDLHARGDEEAWWRDRKIEPLDAADQLWSESRRKLSIERQLPAANDVPAEP